VTLLIPPNDGFAAFSDFWPVSSKDAGSPRTSKRSSRLSTWEHSQTQLKSLSDTVTALEVSNCAAATARFVSISLLDTQRNQPPPLFAEKAVRSPLAHTCRLHPLPPTNKSLSPLFPTKTSWPSSMPTSSQARASPSRSPLNPSPQSPGSHSKLQQRGSARAE
jgi:hypothetical protein